MLVARLTANGAISMAWQGVEGHDAVLAHFRRALRRGRLASTFLFVGPAGIGKRLFAEKLAQSLLCQAAGETALEPCGTCDACVQVAALAHPDLMIVEKPPEKSFIPVELVIGDAEHRMREGLCHDIALKPFMGGRKVAIVDDADELNEEGANALLKTLEEPPPRSVLILIGTSADRQLPTIRSRCQLVRFRPLDNGQVARILQLRGLVADAKEAARQAEFSGGSVRRALELADPELWTFRGELLEALARPRLASVSIAQATTAFVDAAGKEAPHRRARSRQIAAFAADFYRQLLRVQTGMDAEGDEPLVQAARQASANRPDDVETTSACIDRTLATLRHIDRNAHQATLLECWFDDLAHILQTGQPAASYE
jgi:DNA polymerase-3 subunit delta'